MKGSIMRAVTSFYLALFAAAAFASPALAANICQAEKLTCATNMPVGGFCECTSHGTTQDGTVVKKPEPHRKVNATAGGCGAQPGAPGCR
jgi:hypothetical protein